MNIRRYTASDLREALALVRARHGPDAVLLSHRRVVEGVEVSIATDAEVSAAAELASAADARGGEVVEEGAGFAALFGPRAEREAPVDARDDELRTLRRMLESQLAALAWNDLSRRSPVASEVLRELTQFGFARDVSADVIDHLPRELEFTPARRLAIARLADRVRVTGDRFADFGGRLLVVGAPGAGKTSLVTKLAARAVMRHGTAEVAIVGTDERRLGAQAQLAHTGRVLGVATYAVRDLAELPRVLQHLERRRLVLVDTAGIAARDPSLPAAVEALRAAAPGVDVAVAVAATTQAASVEEQLRAWGPLGPAFALLTRLDECTTLGGVLSALMRAGLPLGYVSDGARIPEDLRPARALDLVCHAVQLAERYAAAADEDLLQRRYPEIARARA